jgi:hypothetical protein
VCCGQSCSGWKTQRAGCLRSWGLSSMTSPEFSEAYRSSRLQRSSLAKAGCWIGWPMCQRLAGCISSRSTSYSQSNRQPAAYSRERALYGGTSGVWIGSWSCSAWLLISQVASLLEGFPMVSRYLSYSNSQRNRQLDARRIALQWSDCVRIYLMINRNAPLGERNLGKELNLIC